MKMITLKVDEIRQKVSSHLSEKFNKDNFSFSKTNSWFIKSTEKFDQILYLLIHSRSDHYAIEPQIYIRYKQVEKLLKKIIGNTNGITMGDSISVIYNSPDGRKIVRNSMEILLLQNEDIESAVETIGQYYIDIAIPYFDKYIDIDSLDDIFNKPPFEYTPADVGGMTDDRCMRGLIIARLSNNPNYQELLTTYDQTIKRTMNQQSIDDYNKVKDYLNHNRI
jgi:hypothetical protein